MTVCSWTHYSHTHNTLSYSFITHCSVNKIETHMTFSASSSASVMFIAYHKHDHVLRTMKISTSQLKTEKSSMRSSVRDLKKRWVSNQIRRLFRFLWDCFFFCCECWKSFVSSMMVMFDCVDGKNLTKALDKWNESHIRDNNNNNCAVSFKWLSTISFFLQSLLDLKKTTETITTTILSPCIIQYKSQLRLYSAELAV